MGGIEDRGDRWGEGETSGGQGDRRGEGGQEEQLGETGGGVSS